MGGGLAERPGRRLAGAAPTAAEPARLIIPPAVGPGSRLDPAGQRTEVRPGAGHAGGLVSTPVNSIPARMTAMDAGKLAGGSEVGLVLLLLSALPRQRRHDGSATCVQAWCFAGGRPAGRARGRPAPTFRDRDDPRGLPASKSTGLRVLAFMKVCDVEAEVEIANQAEAGVVYSRPLKGLCSQAGHRQRKPMRCFKADVSCAACWSLRIAVRTAKGRGDGQRHVTPGPASHVDHRSFDAADDDGLAVGENRFMGRVGRDRLKPHRV